MSKVTIDLVSDTRDFERGMRGAAKATDDLRGSLDGASHGFGQARSQIKGTQALMKGLEATMGANLQASVDTLSGYANLAKGIKGGLIPALKQGSAAFLAMSKTMLATPWGRIAAAVAVVGTAVVATSTDADQMGRAFGALRTGVEYDIGKIREWGNAFLGALGVGKGEANEFGYAMDELFYSTEAVGDAALTMAAHAKSAALTFGAAIQADIDSTSRLDGWLRQAAASALKLRIAAQLGGTPDDPDGAFASAAAVAAMNDTMSGPIIPPVVKAARVKMAKVAKTMTETWVDEFKSALAKPSPLARMQDALAKFNDKVANAKSVKAGLKDLFKLDFADSDYRNVPAGLKSQLARWEKFIKVFGELRKKGLAPSLLSMFADAGPAALDEMNKVNHASIGDINEIAKRGEKLVEGWANSETKRQTGVDVNKPGKVKVTLNVSGGDKELVNLIKKWVRVEGGGDVQVAFGKK